MEDLGKVPLLACFIPFSYLLIARGGYRDAGFGSGHSSYDNSHDRLTGLENNKPTKETTETVKSNPKCNKQGSCYSLKSLKSPGILIWTSRALERPLKKRIWWETA